MFKLPKSNTLRKTVTIAFAVFFLGLIFCPISLAETVKANEVKVQEVKSQEANAKEIKISIPELIDLGASQCPACKKMTVILDELADEYNGAMKVTFIDVWKNENVPIAEKYNVKKIPTQIFLSPEGKILWRHIGFINKDSILAKWKELGYEFQQSNTKVSSETSSLPIK